MRKIWVAAIVMAAGISGPAANAQDKRGTPEQRAACMSDAFRLCSDDIPDADKVESCLRQHRPDLSETCRSAFEPRPAAQGRPR